MNFWHLFRLIFVIFSLYLMGDAFYRWDGFKYYASFFEFLPSVALISILWSIIAALTTIIIWLLFAILNWICKFLKLRVSSEHAFLNTWFLVLIGAIVWTSKKLIFPGVQTTPEEKIIIVVSGVLLSVFLTWFLRRKAERLISTVSDRISPLVWLFGVIVGLSLPVVTFYALWEPLDKTMPSGPVQSSEADRNRPNIILVTYDALTAEDMSVYGYHRQTTPFIAEWAKTATIFKKCEASSSSTYTTVPSLMTGKRVWTHQAYHPDAGIGKPGKIDVESLPLLLKKGGYYNMAFTANDRASVKQLGMSDSFHVKPSFVETMVPVTVNGFLWENLFKYFGGKVKLYDWILKEDFIWNILIPMDFIMYPYKTEHPVEKVYDMFLNELDNNAPEPFFAWMHLMPPHAPYLPPKQYVGIFDPSPKFRTYRSQYDLINPRYYTPEQQTDADIIRGRYDEFIRYCDKEFEHFIKKLSSIKKLDIDNTVIILSSDHGESFEHGVFRHGSPTTLFDEMTHIPLIIKEPAQNEGRIIDFPVEQIDITSTILDLAHISAPPWVEGRSLAPLLRGKELQPRTVFSMDFQAVPVRGGHVEINKGIIAVWEGDYKLIHYIASKKNLLFNLKVDPDEMNNLFSTDIEVGQHLLTLIQDNLAKANERIRGEK